MTQPVVHLIFKTHLDIGFTDYASSVVQTYFQHFIPQAVALAQRTRQQEEGLRFRWTTGAWLIYQYLEQAAPAQRQAMEQAITAGDILWHALPFTTHTELMDESLFRFGLGYSQRLDQRFGRTTIAAKMTDVPGHTRAMVPLLAEAGIRLLHIGVNEASSVPDVPPLFVWRDEASSAEIIVMYHGAYGGVTTVPGLSDALAVVLTGDNHGPPSEAAIGETYAALAAQLPGARVTASSFDAYAQQLETVRADLPVITAEIGDTWIHGVGTDPTKVRRYRELCRLRREWLQRPLNADEQAALEQFSHHLIMVPEHTWGMDEKTHLPNHTHYDAPALAQLRQTEACRRFEKSWAEQRTYIETALQSLQDTPLALEAADHLRAIEPRRPDLSGCQPADHFDVQAGPLNIAFDPATGAIRHLSDQHASTIWADDEHPLGLLVYEVFGQSDYDRFWNQYNRNRDDPMVRRWAIEDFTKPGIPNQAHAQWQPTVTAAYRDADSRMIFALALPPQSQQFGAPRQCFLEYRFDDAAAGQIEIIFSWFDKPACRLPEAFWLSFVPRTRKPDGWMFEKMGQRVSPTEVISRGARTLHAVDQAVHYRDGERTFSLTTLDAPLVAPGQRALLNFHNGIPDMRGGVHVNLYNNIWGTNFPMWFEEDAVFRFRLRLG